MNPEQFEALIEMIRAMIAANSTAARLSSDGGLIEAIQEGEAIGKARILLVDPEIIIPPRKICSGCGCEIDGGNYPTRNGKPRCQQCYFANDCR